MARSKHTGFQDRMQGTSDEGQCLFHAVAPLAIFHFPAQIGAHIKPVFPVFFIQVVESVLQPV